MVQDGSIPRITDKPLHSSPVLTTFSISRTDSGYGDGGDLGRSIEKAQASNPSTRARRSQSNHGSRRSSRSSTRPSTSQFSIDHPRPRPTLHSYHSSLSSRHESTNEELHALYTRSCAILKSTSVSTGGLPDIPPPPSGLHSGRSSIRSLPPSQANQRTQSLPRYTTLGSSLPALSSLAQPEPPTSEPVPYSIVAPSTTYWLSPESRAAQQAEIEKSCKGWRGFLRRARRTGRGRNASRTGEHMVDFWDDKRAENDDDCSVRRYRIDISAKNEKAETKDVKDRKTEDKVKGWFMRR